jgi:hypothetical protein
MVLQTYIILYLHNFYRASEGMLSRR